MDDLGIRWEPQRGPQTVALQRQEKEIFYGGARGGGKTETGIVWVALPALEKDARDRYVHPYYRALVLRRHADDLKDWFDRAEAKYVRMGAKRVGSASSGGYFLFPSGAKIHTGHLRDAQAYTKYIGHEYQRMVIEEATLIPQEEMYERLLGSCRSKYPKLPPQIFLTTNPGGPGHCVDEGEVLTPAGWKDIREFQVGDSVYTVLPDGSLAETTVEQVHASYYEGDLIRVNARGLYISCTPNHSVAKAGGVRQGMNTRDRSHSRFSLVPFETLPGQATILRSVAWKGTPLKDFSVPRTAHRRRLSQPTTISGFQFMELLGWFLSEGSTIAKRKIFLLSQSKPECREQIDLLLRDSGFSFKWGKTSAVVHAPDWWSYFRQFGRSREKFIPYWAKQASPEYLDTLLFALMAGDGHWERPGVSGEYYTISKRLADDVAEIALKLGYVVHVNTHQRKNRKGLSYVVSFKVVQSGGTEILTGNHIYDVETSTARRSDIQRVPYSGMVYCIGVPGTHSFVIRQKGSIWVSGNSWVRKRFILREDGRTKQAPGVPFQGKDGNWRIWIPATVDDNPILIQADPGYLAYLESLPPALRKAWREGDWDAFLGQYFPEFRPYGPIGEEALTYPWANHVIEPVHLEPWWHRWISGDWGYNHPSSVHWFCQHENGQIHVYRELHVRGLGSKELGVMIARQTEQDLRGLPEPYMTLSFGKDIFRKTDEGPTQAQQIAAGIDEHLGKGTAILLSPDDPPREIRPSDGVPRIIIRIASDARVAGWMNVRDFLRFKRIFPDEDRPLPTVQIWNTCPYVIEQLQTLVFDDDGPNPEDALKVDAIDGVGGDDAADSFRYGLMAYTLRHNVAPLSVYVSEKLNALSRKYNGNVDPTIAYMVAQHAEMQYGKLHKTAKPINFARLSSRKVVTNVPR